MAKETKVFQTEVKEILNLMINSLYSHREIFLRELVSNSCDAMNKLRFEEITHPEWATQDKHLRLIPNKEQKTLAIVDSGIGMTREDLVKNIGTIAYSGTKEFLKKAKDLKDHPELIGQFGVGFYSAFMVADKVVIHTQHAGSGEGVVWESQGDGQYTLDSCPRPEGTGTTITLFLKTFDDDEEAQDFADAWTLKSLVRKYSDFVEFPIRMKMTSTEPELDQDGKAIEGKTKTVETDETLNSQKAIWLRASKDVTDEQYNDFYKHLTHDWQNPVERIHYKAEGTQEFSALLYLPETVPYDYNHRDMKYGLNLYVKRVFITDFCEQLIPPFLRFLKGVVDSSDLPLNVSREMIQKDKHISMIKKAITTKVMRHLKTMLEKNRDLYEKFFKNFGSTIKEGAATDFTNKKEIEELLLFHSTKSDSYTTLKEYLGRMKENQKAIYYMTGENIETLKGSPYLEKISQKGFEVLYLTDPVDEWVANAIHEFEGKKLLSIAKDQLDLDDNDESAKEALKTKEEELKPLTESLQKILSEHVRDVKVTDRLVDSPVCLVSGAQDPSAHMERMMEAMGQKMPKTKRILEINPKHPIFAKMRDFSDAKKTLWAEILYSQALLNEGSALKDPIKFSKQISELMTSV